MSSRAPVRALGPESLRLADSPSHKECDRGPLRSARLIAVGAAERLTVSYEQRRVLEAWIRSRGIPARVVERCKAILMASEGVSNRQIAAELGVSRPAVIRWRRRFAVGGTAGLNTSAEGAGRKPSIPVQRVASIVVATTDPPEGGARWSRRTMAKAHGVSPATIARIWDAHGVAPHRVATLELPRDVSRDREILPAVVGVFLNPPDKVAALCIADGEEVRALAAGPLDVSMNGQSGAAGHDAPSAAATVLEALKALDAVAVGQPL